MMYHHDLRMAIIYAITNQKGGVGKTTTAVNVSTFLAAAGKRVLLLDMDPQANASSSLGINRDKVEVSSYDVILGDASAARAVLHNNKLNLSIIPAVSALAAAEIELVGQLNRERMLYNALAGELPKYDYVIIDCPPSLGLLTINALTASNGVIIPVQCEYLALEGLTLLNRTVHLVRQRLNPTLEIRGLIMTMYDSRTALAQQVVAEVGKFFVGKVFATHVPRSVRLSEAPSYGQPIMTYAPNSLGSVAYSNITKNIIEQDSMKEAPTENQ